MMAKVDVAKVDVAIVGFGPVGAVLACLLGQAGLDTVVIDQAETIYDKPRALALDHEIARVLQGLGLGEALEACSEPFTDSVYLGADGRVIKRLTMLPEPHPQGWTPSMVFLQPALEAAVRQKAQSLASVSLRLGRQVSALAQDGGGVGLTMTGPAGPETVEARYVVGCDGAGSTIRKLAGLTLEDLGFDEPWLVVDVLANERGLAKLPQSSMQYCEPDRPTTYVIGKGAHRRWEFSLNPGEDPRRMEQPDAVWRLLSRWMGPDEGVLWRSASYRFHALVARDWRNGRVFIAGDAAHQQPPFLGQGLCQGVRDAANLAWKLEAVIRQGAPDALLGSYGPERRGHVAALTGIIKSIGGLIGERDRGRAAARDERLIAEAGGVVQPMPRQDLMPVLAEGFLSDRPSPGRGALFPQPWIRSGEGTVRLDDHVGRGFRLFGRAGVAPSLEQLLQAFGWTFVPLGGEGGIAERAGVLAGWFDRHGVENALVRPDHAVFGTARDAAGAEALVREAGWRLGLAATAG
jgi:3-(3-hydroxy-phenyl)propionate hydroxylase